jgi:hypothetical protein
LTSVAEVHLPSDEASIKKTPWLIPSPFEEWAAPRGYHLVITPLDSGETLYVSSRTRAEHDAWKGGAG